MFSRNIDDLTIAARAGYEKFKIGMDRRGIPFIVTCTLRTHEAQFALYAQGRMEIKEVNKLRHLLRWRTITAIQNKIVTWTLHSQHLPVTPELVKQGRALPEDMGKSRAFDIVIMRDSHPTWEPKADINDNEVPDYLEAAEIGQQCGLVAGALWKEPDLCHYQTLSRTRSLQKHPGSLPCQHVLPLPDFPNLSWHAFLTLSSY